MNNLELQSPVLNREKIRTPFARIIVGGNLEKTYYNIMWWQDGEMYVGFGSTNLSFVRKWLSEEFEVDSPAGDVVVARNGRWKHDGDYRSWSERIICSECGQFGGTYAYQLSPYCPHCGAKMQEGIYRDD